LPRKGKLICGANEACASDKMSCHSHPPGVFPRLSRPT
jgi:hypothetical protein